MALFALPAAWTAKKIIFAVAPYVVIAGMAFALWGVWGWKEAAEADKAMAEADLKVALAANAEAELAAEKLRRQQESDRRLTAQVIEDTKAAALATGRLKKEQRHAPDAEKRLDPYWDDFADRLRALDAGSGGG